MLIGMGNPVQTLPISAAALREVDLIGVFRYAKTYEEAIKLVASNNPLLPDLKKLITQRFDGLDNAPQAFELAGEVKDEKGDLVLKVLLDTTKP
jgi:L-iditol 2-dehydrogenase